MVIVLNYDYTFLNRVTVRKALLYMAKDKVTVEKASDDEVIRSFSDIMQAPLVIRLTYLIKTIYSRKVIWTKRNVMVRDNFTCKLCGGSPADINRLSLEVDHIRPIADWGRTEVDNLQTLCKDCNRGKGTKV